jgi:hypothetical protein
MGIYLDKFSKVKALKQGYEVHKLVKSNRNRLMEDPDRKFTAERYSTLGKAIMTVFMRASRKDVQSYIGREGKYSAAIALATIIFDQTVIHPEEGEVTGNNLDFFLAGLSSTNSLNRQLAEELVRANRKITFEEIPTDAREGMEQAVRTENYLALFVAVQTDSTLPPLGFTRAEELHVDESLQLRPLGELRELAVPEGQKDTYGIAAVGRVTQLYYRKPSQTQFRPY